MLILQTFSLLSLKIMTQENKWPIHEPTKMVRERLQHWIETELVVANSPETNLDVAVDETMVDLIFIPGECVSHAFSRDQLAQTRCVNSMLITNELLDGVPSVYKSGSSRRGVITDHFKQTGMSIVRKLDEVLADVYGVAHQGFFEIDKPTGSAAMGEGRIKRKKIIEAKRAESISDIADDLWINMTTNMTQQLMTCYGGITKMSLYQKNISTNPGDFFLFVISGVVGDCTFYTLFTCVSKRVVDYAKSKNKPGDTPA